MERRGSQRRDPHRHGRLHGHRQRSKRLHVLVLDDGGQPDPSFGTAGLATFDATGDPDAPPFGVPPAPQAGHDVVLGATGDITIAGGQGRGRVRRAPEPGRQPAPELRHGRTRCSSWRPEFDEVALYPDG